MIYILLLLLTLILFMLYRVNWVYKYRSKLLDRMISVSQNAKDDALDEALAEARYLQTEYFALPSYERMVLQVWKWKY